MESMEESWEGWFQDLEIAGDFMSFAFGADHEFGNSSSQENFDTETFNAGENGVIITSNPSSSKSVNAPHLTASNSHLYAHHQVDSVFMLEDKASFDDPLKTYSESQRNIKEREMSSEGRNRNPQVQDHLIAERMRRGKISQHFIALSALIPGLKRADKASVLEGAINHVKQLQVQVKMLEDQQTNKKKKARESVVFVKKSQLISMDDHDHVTDMALNHSSSDTENSHDVATKCNRTVADADVEARVSDKNVLIRIQCEKQEGIMVKMMMEIEKLHLSMVNSSVVPFGRSILDITIIAEMEDEFNLSVKELARNLRVALLRST